ncbi:MAG TPA: hypothetical protein VFL49_05020, partial [Pseudolabrys sp.]|nr:hypothetical protein [Pseudolabrys sp.]
MGLIKRGFECFELAELDRSFVTDPCHRAAEQAQCDLRGQIDKSPRFYRDRRPGRQFDEQVGNGTLDGPFDGNIRSPEPPSEPGQLGGIET